MKTGPIYNLHNSLNIIMKTLEQVLKPVVSEVLAESVRVNYEGHQFLLKLDTNENPNKKGIKIQFIPTSFTGISKTSQDDIAMSLQKKLDDGLSQYGLQVERDRDLKNKSIIGFFIYIEYFNKIVRTVLQKQAN